MEKLYHSKGISKAAIAGRLISVAMFVVIAISLFVLSEAKVEGPTQNISIGGGPIQQVTTERNRFTSSEQQSIIIGGFVAVIFATADAAMLVLFLRSWTDIYPDSIQANSMGKTVSCRIADITEVSVNGSRLQVSGPTGKTVLITEDPQKARKIVEDLILKR